jgi:DNA-binding transcriptional ArsR family regulator
LATAKSNVDLQAMVSICLRLVMTNASIALKALGDPTRQLIFEQLAKRPLAVVELANVVPISRPAVSQHLKVLKDAGLVIVRQQGTRHFYQVDPKGVEMMRQYLDRMWDKALASFKAFAEREGPKP